MLETLFNKMRFRNRSAQLTMSDTLAAYFMEELQSTSFRLPSSSLLYDSRISFDLATMLWAREMIFSRSAERVHPWVIHLRADSSPQWGRDFLLCQCDIIQYGENFMATTIKKRLLPLQCVGSRAGGASSKLSKMIHSISLESEHVH